MQIYIQALGAHFPGTAVSNDEAEARLGQIGGQRSRVRSRVLSQNGIQSRHYAVDAQQQSQTSNSLMAARALQLALRRGGLKEAELEYLAAATTQGDLIVPGFGSLVHQQLGGGRLDLDSLHGVCASGVMALRAAWRQLQSGELQHAAACASEFPSRLFKASRYEALGYGQKKVGGRTLPFDTEFLRWMLSDGAGAALLGTKPNPTGLSLKIDWIRLTSFATSYPLAMSCGSDARGGIRHGEFGKSWLDYDDFEQAASAGALDLHQDVRLLQSVVELGVAEFFRLVKTGIVEPEKLDWMVCHYSSLFFRKEIFRLLRLGGLKVEEERWFSNLPSRGNVGSASCFVLLEELMQRTDIKPGQKIFLIVPESGGSIMGYAQFTVVAPDSTGVVVDAARNSSSGVSPQPTTPEPSAAESSVAARPPTPSVPAPQLKITANPIAEALVRDLTVVWVEFTQGLQNVPLIARLLEGRFTLEDYRTLLINLRQQVVEGGRWIARAASNISIEAFTLRSLFIGHAHEEHRDYQMLERDFVAVGGSLEEIQQREKNIGSAALSAWMFHQASQPNPFDLLGAMFIIEGLGLRIASSWGASIKQQLQLRDEQIRFLSYHGENDPTHLAKLEQALSSPLLTEELARRIVKTAKVTARLYRLQLEELDSL